VYLAATVMKMIPHGGVSALYMGRCSNFTPDVSREV
jgi:hypothetical protein